MGALGDVQKVTPDCGPSGSAGSECIRPTLSLGLVPRLPFGRLCI